MVFAQLMESFESSLSVIPQIWANRKAADALIDKLAAALQLMRPPAVFLRRLF